MKAGASRLFDRRARVGQWQQGQQQACRDREARTKSGSHARALLSTTGP